MQKLTPSQEAIIFDLKKQDQNNLKINKNRIEAAFPPPPNTNNKIDFGLLKTVLNEYGYSFESNQFTEPDLITGDSWLEINTI